MLQLRVFTVKEANQLIPSLEGLLVKIRARTLEIEKKEVEIDALELILDPEDEKGEKVFKSELEALNALIAGFNGFVDEIQKHGCVLKDVEKGLIDFYSVVDGKVVYLCWQYGEKEIQFWHEIGEGFSSRHPL